MAYPERSRPALGTRAAATIKASLRVLVAVAIVASPGIPFAAADGPLILAQQQRNCAYQGRTFTHGTRLGHLICNDGRWVPG